MLASFVFGVILVGIGRAVGYYRANWLFSKWADDVSKYYQNDIEWAILLNKDNDRSKDFVWGDVVSWLSFFCFLGGIFVGMSSFFRGR